MKLKSLAITSIGIIFSTNALAESLWPILETKTCSPVVAASLGPALTNSTGTKNISLHPDIAQNYRYNRKSQIFGSGEIFAGWQAPINLNLLGQLGLVLAGGFDAPIKGEIWNPAVSSATDYNYSYKVNHAHIALKGKVLTDTNTVLQPYFSGSVGMGSNSAHNFTLQPSILPNGILANVGDMNSTGLVYSLGLGVQNAYSENWYVGLGYEFADWGQLKLARRQNQTLNTELGINHFYTNQIQLSVSYVFTSRASR